MDGDNELEILITAIDEASAVIEEVKDSAYDAQNAIMDVSIQQAMAADDATASLTTEAEATDFLESKIQTMGTRFIAHALIIGSVIAAYNFLKSAVADSEKANADYVKQFDAADQQLKNNATDVGNAVLPAFENLKQTLADISVQNGKTQGSFLDLGGFIMSMSQGAQIAIVAIAGAMTLLGDGVKIVLDSIKDNTSQWAEQLVKIGGGISDLVNHNWVGAFQAFSQVTQTKGKDVSDSTTKMKDDFTFDINEMTKILDEATPKLNDIVPDTTVAKTSKNLKTIVDNYSSSTALNLNTLQTAQDQFNKMSDDRVIKVTNEVNDEIAEFNRLFTAVGSGKASGGTFNVPGFADGGIVTSPTLAMVGEAGPEAIIPLSDAGAGGFGTTINITINGDVSGEELVQKVGDKLVRILQLSSATV